MVLMADLYLKGCAAQAPLEVQLLPAAAAVADHARPPKTILAKGSGPGDHLGAAGAQGGAQASPALLLRKTLKCCGC